MAWRRTTRGGSPLANEHRYAVYLAPHPGDFLWNFGCMWLGRAAEGVGVPARPPLTGFGAGEIDAATRSARRYGFHATLKPPFRLARGRSESELLDFAKGFAYRTRAFRLPRLAVRAIGGFLALVPAAPSPEADELAGACVRGFDRFRDGPGQDELARRRAAGLTARQDALLERWGYPYVFDEFRLHFTLTDRLAKDGRERTREVLERLWSPHAAEEYPVGSICIFEQAAAGRPFHQLRRFPLEGVFG
ncbi:MAG: DUF1045 domain-containing protein [Alphaproteobacteria bacterium]|nr:DUF1045 domain-containing protein [Alphaproteobacteria bacterium]